MGKLETVPALSATDLLAAPVSAALHDPDILVAPIDPTLADTAEFCAAYDVGLEQSANCVVVAGKREGELRYAACVILATTRADVNGVVRKRLDVRKLSFAPMDDAVSLTGMEYGGITPIGLPAGWPVLIDSRVVDVPQVIIGSGLRRSKIVLPGAALARLASAEVIPDLAR
ncbi:YbaK/EbsC family protein [Dactylosporangium siamense]|uniref:YbaK/EbsC family protein n=1 Tax=Dactylosporangium siamense TaxID=685454 RepID=UPI001942BA44|nr:YbaK/EbsC family protein [Dactylosporangium siamense]